MDKKIRRLQICISLIAVLLIVIHIAVPSIAIDAITLSLFVIAIVPWLHPLFKSLEVPGGLKFEFQDLQDIMNMVDEVGLIEFRGGGGKVNFSFLYAAENNEPLLTFAGLYLEIERVLYELYAECCHDMQPRSIDEIISKLNAIGILSQNEEKILKEILHTLKFYMEEKHGDHKSMEIVALKGPGIVWALESKLFNCASG